MMMAAFLSGHYFLSGILILATAIWLSCLSGVFAKGFYFLEKALCETLLLAGFCHLEFHF